MLNERIEVHLARRAAEHGSPDGHTTLLASAKKVSAQSAIWNRPSFGIERLLCRIMTLHSKNAKSWALI